MTNPKAKASDKTKLMLAGGILLVAVAIIAWQAWPSAPGTSAGDSQPASNEPVAADPAAGSGVKMQAPPPTAGKKPPAEAEMIGAGARKAPGS